jgi:uncharacterized damage-inducible protein DinB
MAELSATAGDEAFVPRRPATGDALLSSSGQIATQMFLERSRYYLSGEYLPKLRHCVAALPDELVWHRANDSSNSIGNLLMHLSGNVRQWIVAGIGGQPLERDRAAEFSARDGPPAQSLISNLESALADADAVLAKLSTDDLTRPCTIQGRETTVLAAIYHVVEHFAMHTGQIVLLTKAHVPGAIHFYDDSDRTTRPLRGGEEGIR